jgi:putative nucleotidyltransferase with HDIG domain|tara:strand:+ start:122 stop:664 length:543 start_codon:yes stop_codon:yes gene_type:complete
MQLLKDYSKRGDIIVRHGLAVEAAMRAYATKFGGDPEYWGIAGLVHDFDWDVCPTPEEHPTFGANILKDKGFPEDIIRAVLTHGEHTGIERINTMEKTLFAVDELTGFVVAVALVRPSKSLEDTKVSSVKKKFKDKAFAKGVIREDIFKGSQELGVELDDHIAFIIEALKPVATQLGLNP